MDNRALFYYICSINYEGTKIYFKMKVQILQSGYIERIRLDDELVIKIAKANGVRFSSVERWLRDNSQKLTTATNLSIIRDHFGLPETEILTTEEDILV